MANIKKRTVCIIPDVAANEKLTFDNRLPEPTILFGGFVIEPVSAGLLDAAGQAQGRQRAVFHAVFLVADHLLNDTTASAVVRQRGEQIIVHDLGDHLRDHASE